MRRLVMSWSAAALVLVGGVVAGSAVGGAAGQPETVPSTEPATVTTEAAAASTEGAATEAPDATEASVPSTDGAVESSAPAAPAEGHPIIGTWMISDTSDPENPSPFVAFFSAEGSFLQVEEGDVELGVWEATGPTSAALTLTGQDPDEGGGTFTIRATFEVAPDGQSLSAEYTLEVSGVEGVPTGEYGPGSASGTRVVVEPMGTPVGSLEDLFGGFEGTEPTSEDTAMVAETTVAATETTSMVTETTTS